jgi:ankyrin repeat protein
MYYAYILCVFVRVYVLQVDVNEAVVLPSGLRLLHVAAFHQQAHIVSQLIEMGADVNLVDDEGGYNPLTMAIIGGNLSAALELITAGADIRMPSQSGRAPM